MKKILNTKTPIEEILKATQEELFKQLGDTYSDSIKKEGSYILVEGQAPILLVAHLDTVHRRDVKEIIEKDGGNILTSPEGIGGDDRCGVYALINIYEKAEIKPWLLFTCDEEKGCIGAEEFAFDVRDNMIPSGLEDIKMIVELDRKGADEAVYYACANYEFEDYITSKGFVTDSGTSSDIRYVAPVLKIAAVNLSCGYHNAHTLNEYIDLRELQDVMVKVEGIVKDVNSEDVPQFKYIN